MYAVKECNAKDRVKCLNTLRTAKKGIKFIQICPGILPPPKKNGGIPEWGIQEEYQRFFATANRSVGPIKSWTLPVKNNRPILIFF